MPSPTALVVLFVLAVPQAQGDLRAERDAIRDRETKDLDAIAAGLKGDEADAVRALREPVPAADGSTGFLPLGEVVAAVQLKESDDVRRARLDAAKAYFRLADKALKATPQHLALADECLRRVVVREPAHAEAHRLLGYVPHEGGWATPFAVKKLTNGDVLHPKYGWVEKDWVPHLDRGELPAPRVARQPTRWLPAAEADALRRDFKRGWQIATEHFAILTNVTLAEAIDFGRHLEAFDELFTSRMADVIGPADLPLAKLAKDPKLSPDKLPAKKPHRVNYYADKEEYVDVLSPMQGADIRNTLGIFLPAKELRAKEGISFFYRDPGGQLAETETLFHEVSHQLLFEMTPGKYDPERPNFWVYEGLGTYFETVRPQQDGTLRVGGLVGKRIAVAQDRVIGRREFVPIGRMASYNKFLFNGGTGGDIYLNYAEAMALTVFFMDAGRYREDFLDYARDVYKGRIKPGAGKPLEVRLGIDDGTLGQEFLAFLKPRAGAQAEGR
jgi:hypothetical protein